MQNNKCMRSSIIHKMWNQIIAQFSWQLVASDDPKQLGADFQVEVFHSSTVFGAGFHKNHVILFGQAFT